MSCGSSPESERREGAESLWGSRQRIRRVVQGRRTKSKVIAESSGPKSVSEAWPTVSFPVAGQGGTNSEALGFRLRLVR